MTGSGTGSQTLARGLSALQMVADSPSGLTVQQLADRVGVHRTIAYRLLSTLAEFPPRQKAASFNLDEVMSKLKEPGAGSPD